MLDRIRLILKIKNLSSAKFAEEIGVQRSGISHILSGRNKPSLEFVHKLLNRFSDINSEWLILGKGEMIKSEVNRKEIEVQTEINYENNSFLESDLMKNEDLQAEEADEKGEKKKIDRQIDEDLKKSTEQQSLKMLKENDDKALNSNEIERIMIFYTNKTFIEYKPA
ncbi:MAG: helix-turn-helix transcriptional regulator [Bacteroidales bacterium]|nr:helix-turn-helix transcriptional regulator [Bacteroidales bacterium]